MTHENLVRQTLRLSFFFNLLAAYLLIFPNSPLGELAGFTLSNSVMHTALSALTVGALGIAYGWLSRQACISRPLLTLGALIKGGAFVSFFVLWLFEAVNLRLVLFAIVDIVLAILWISWMVRTKD